METLKPGIYPGVSQKEYREWDAVNISSLKNFEVSPSNYEWYQNHPRKETEQQAFGHLVHTLMLEPHLLDEEYISKPATYPAKATAVDVKKGLADEKGVEIDKPWNGNADYCRSWLKSHAGKRFITPDDLEYARILDRKARANPDIAKFLDTPCPNHEVSIVWIDEMTGILCKGRCDVLAGNQIGDVKTTSKRADYDKWGGQAVSFKYCEQAAFYMDGLKALLGEKYHQSPRFRWIVCESFPPYRVTWYDLVDVEGSTSRPALDYGREKYRSWLQELRHAIETDEFVDWPVEMCGEFCLPEWVTM